MKVFTGGRKTERPTRICLLHLLGVGGNGEKRFPQRACLSAGDEIGLLVLEKQKGRGRSTCFLSISGLWISRSVCWSRWLGSTGDWGRWVRKATAGVLCRHRDEPRGLELEERKKASSFGLLVSLAHFAGVFPVNDCWCWRLEYLDEFQEGMLEKIIFVIHCRWVKQENETVAVFLLQSWEIQSRGEERSVWIHCQPIK